MFQNAPPPLGSVDQQQHLVCITLSWLRQHIPDSVIAINGYNIIRWDRKEAIHGGVCMFIKETIPFSVLDLSEVDESPDFEVLWAKLRPTRLPRDLSSITSGVIYHPPSAPDSQMQGHLLKCLTSVESQHPKSGILLVGDLNRLNEATLKFNFNLKQIVHFPTRGKRFLDRILTNLKDFYYKAIERPKIGLSDHSSVEIQPKLRAKPSQLKKTIVSRDFRPSKRHAMQIYREKVDVPRLLDTVETCAAKVSLFENIVKTGLDLIISLGSKTNRRSEPPWLNDKLKNLIKRSQCALAKGTMDTFRTLRNCVNRERKICRAKYYEAKVSHLRENKPSAWWKEVKKLSGMSSASETRDDTSILLQHLNFSPGDLANYITSAFLTPIQSFEPLAILLIHHKSTTKVMPEIRYRSFQLL